MIKLLRGNDFSIKIPLQKVTVVNGVNTVVDYPITEDDEVTVNLCSGTFKRKMDFSYVSNCIAVACSGLPNGSYSVEILIKKGDGHLRSFKVNQFQIVDSNEESNLPVDSEFSYSEILLSSSIMFSLGRDGKPFTYADFTDTEIAELQRPALTAATAAQALEDKVSAAETVRVANEKNRVNSEIIRGSNESERVSNETARKTSETSRANAETVRASNESVRVSNENTRISNENNRIAAENTRTENEAKREAAINSAVAECKTTLSSIEASATDAENAANAALATVASAKEATSSANTAAANANEKAAQAEIAATSANQAASSAVSSAENANNAASSAVAAITSITNTQTEISNNEAQRQANEEVRKSNEVTRQSNESVRQTGETTRQTNESLRQSAETARETNTSAAISNCEDTADHPTYIGEDNYVYKWNKTSKVYEKTTVYVKGDTGDNGVEISSSEPTDLAKKVWINPDGTADYILTVEGKSAYQVWLAQGNTGTVDDFMLAIKGTKGDKGDTGDSGVQISDSEPTDSVKNVWIDTDEEADAYYNKSYIDNNVTARMDKLALKERSNWQGMELQKVDTPIPLNLGSKWSIELYINVKTFPALNNYARYFVISSPSDNIIWIESGHTSITPYFLKSDGTQITKGTATSNAHLVINNDNNNVTLYFNGVKSIENLTVKELGTTFNMYLGKRDYYDGSIFINLLRFYNHILNQDEVDFLYNQGRINDVVLGSEWRLPKTNIYTANFSSGVDGFGIDNNTVGSRTISSVNGKLRIYTNSIETTPGRPMLRKYITYTNKSKVRIRFKIESNLASIRVGSICFNTDLIILNTTVNSGDYFTIDVISDYISAQSDYKLFRVYFDGTSWAIGDYIDISDLTIDTLGITDEFIPQNLCSDKWINSGVNGSDMALSSPVFTTQPPYIDNQMGSGAPSIVPVAAGQHYLDYTNGKNYVCCGKLNTVQYAVSHWKVQN